MNSHRNVLLSTWACKALNVIPTGFKVFNIYVKTVKRREIYILHVIPLMVILSLARELYYK